jgi:HSP20 family protein
MPKAIGGLIEDVFQNGFQKVFGDENWNEGINVPVNIKETDTTYEMHLMAPGLKKEEFKLNVDKNVLHVTYDHKEETTEGAPADKWLRKEYKLRTFRRSFTLNDKVNVMEISAKYSDGVLIVTLPKKEPAQPATQEITVD